VTPDPAATGEPAGTVGSDEGGSYAVEAADLGGDSGISESELSPVLEKLEGDESVKAVVLRIDSPGGSALASDLLWHRLMRIRKKKTLVVSVGEMAASGGYYLASTGNAIIADPVSLLGSIGVVGGKVGIGNGLERFGVHVEVFPAKKDDLKAANRAAYMSPFVSWDEDTKARVRDSMESIYRLFLARVAEGRGTTPEKVAENAEGKIFSGEEAKRLGLVDELGGLEDAIAKARALAKLPADARVHVMSAGGGAIEQLLGGGADARISGVGLLVRELVVPSVAPFVTAYVPLLRGERTLAALPFGIVVQ
jgi:protease-4